MKDLKEFADFTPAIFTREDMAVAEQNCAELGISQLWLMENAGSAVAKFVESRYPKAKRVLVVCGLGNNGGDGFVAARILSKKHKVTAAIAGESKDIKRGSALQNFQALQKTGAVIEDDCGNRIGKLLASCDLVVDAIFGTGFRGAPTGCNPGIIRAINRARVPVVAVDLPSGMDADTGKALLCVKATDIVTFHKNKIGLVKARLGGKVRVADIGIPVAAEILAGSGDVRRATRAREAFSNKKANGSAAIIGGSKGYHGAPLLTSNAAYVTLASLRVGIGYATLYVPKAIENVERIVSPNLVVRAVDGDYITGSAIPALGKAIDKADAVALGIGMGREPSTAAAVKGLAAYIAKKGKRAVVDADAIYALKGVRLSKTVILTPEDKQFMALTGRRPSTSNLKQRVKAAMSLAKKMNAVILLKGHNTVITDGTLVKISVSLSSALATMGTGDVLSGIICGYEASGTEAFRAGVAGAYVHARIGDALSIEKGTHILATDVVDYIPKILKAYDKNVKSK